MSEWMNIDRWPECTQLQRPGYVFEVVNSDDQRMLTQCEQKLPVPFNWRSPPVRFRLVEAPPARHSEPLPKPQRR